MSVREIVLLGDPILREKAEEVLVFNEDLRSLVRDMFDTMVAAEGAGLAAPQIGISKRIFVADIRESRGTPTRFAIVNPRIVEKSDEVDSDSEGCLSIPGVSEVVTRPARVVVEGVDPTGAPIRIEASELLARVIQHEIDHLDGILFFDRITPLKRSLLLKKYRKLVEEEG
jgi:peptide deformylase